MVTAHFTGYLYSVIQDFVFTFGHDYIIFVITSQCNYFFAVYFGIKYFISPKDQPPPKIEWSPLNNFANSIFSKPHVLTKSRTSSSQADATNKLETHLRKGTIVQNVITQAPELIQM